MVRADPGRQKVSFYGTLNLRTGQEIVSQTEKMNSIATAHHLEQVLLAYPDEPILLLWDRAPWHGGAAVRKLMAENPRLEIIKLPVAAPELNPQEQVWKATREAISHNHTFSKMPSLVQAFENYLKNHLFPTSLLDTYGFNAICPMFE